MLIFTYLLSPWYKYDLKSFGRICISKGSKGIGWQQNTRATHYGEGPETQSFSSCNNLETLQQQASVCLCFPLRVKIICISECSGKFLKKVLVCSLFFAGGQRLFTLVPTISQRRTTSLFPGVSGRLWHHQSPFKLYVWQIEMGIMGRIVEILIR